ncbi:hypothetical protein PTTG_00260, partial [Puccinia triticina 1-1 BBBD Race 1]
MPASSPSSIPTTTTTTLRSTTNKHHSLRARPGDGVRLSEQPGGELSAPARPRAPSPPCLLPLRRPPRPLLPHLRRQKRCRPLRPPLRLQRPHRALRLSRRLCLLCYAIQSCHRLVQQLHRTLNLRPRTDCPASSV